MMKNKVIYFGLLLIIILLYFLASNYKLSPPLYYIQKHNFENEQKQLLNLSLEDISILDSITYSRNISKQDSIPDAIKDEYMENQLLNFPSDEISVFDSSSNSGKISKLDSLKNSIRDSLQNSRITDRTRHLSSLGLMEYAKESKKESLIIVLNKEQIEFVNDITKSDYFEELPKKYLKYTNKSLSYDVPLYMKQEDLPLDLSSLNWEKTKTFYFVTNNFKKYGLSVTRINDLYTFDELWDKGMAMTTTNTIPDDILYPYSITKYWLIPVFILVALFPAFVSIKKNLFPVQRREYYNSQRTVALVSIALTFIFLLVVISAFVFEIDMNEGGGVMIFVGSFLFVTSIIIFLIYYTRAIQFDRIYQGAGLNDNKSDRAIYTKWTYDKAFWDDFASLDQKEKLSSNKSMFIIVAVMIVIIFGIFMIADPEVAPVMGYVGLGMLVLMFSVSRLVPMLSAKRLKNSKPECIITNSGLILGRQYHNWKTLGNRLESVRFIKYGKPRLEIIYSFPARYGRQNYTLLVPVPVDQFSTAENIVEILLNEIS